ncbi:TetR/AcrR family transcriptional regulator [Undibacterium sp. Ji67W]|uniref:TetR/AcrR family transcriptional regulator n=1 Tax=Undibacterium sp. Ji67W TaxID=3413042 RepID=UPI003BF14AA9
MKSSSTTSNSFTTRDSLLKSGLVLVELKGLRGLTVRELAAHANVNLGSFVYHFRNRDSFLAELVEIWYQPMYEQLRLTSEAAGNASALSRLKSTLENLIDLVSAKAPFISHLFADAFAGEVAAQKFLLNLPNRHPQIIYRLASEAQREKSIVSGSTLHLVIFIMTAVGMPMLLAGEMMRGCDWLPDDAQKIRNLMRDPDSAKQRLLWALAGIACRE